jgi:hypothetical protein
MPRRQRSPRLCCCSRTFLFSDHFVLVEQLLWSKWDRGVSVPGSADTMSFNLGWVHFALLIGVPFAWRSRCGWRPYLASVVALTLVSLAMCLRSTTPVWEAVPMLRFVQFPWRFLMLATLGATLAGSAVAEWGVSRLSARAAVVAQLALVALPFLAYGPYTKARFYTHRREGIDRGIINRPGRTVEGYLERRRKDGLLLLNSETATALELRVPLITGTAGDDFLPRTVRVVPAKLEPVPLFAQGGEVLIWFGSTPLRSGAALASAAGVVGWLGMLAVCYGRRPAKGGGSQAATTAGTGTATSATRG